ncbi:MAG: hypothetical protein MHM6MM_003663 [Cercozoa sp. M6MM]
MPSTAQFIDELEPRDVPQLTLRQRWHQFKEGLHRPSLDAVSPVLSTLFEKREYSKAALMDDIAAGLTVGVLLVPQSLAYAQLADVPPILGMYASGFPIIVYALLCHSRVSQSGPVAPTSLMIAGAMSSLLTVEDEDSPEAETERTKVAATVAFATGLIQLCLGMLKLGTVAARLMSSPAMNGFTTGAACVIASSQLKYLFGLKDVKKGSNFFDTVYQVCKRLGDTNGWTVLLSVLAIAALLSVKYAPLKHKVPAWFPVPLLLIVIYILLAWLLNLEDHGVILVGDIPSGLPTPAMPELGNLGEALVASIPLAIASFLSSAGLLQAFASQRGETLRADTELRAYGVCQLAESVFGGLVVSASFSRVALNNEMRARTQVAQMVTGTLIVIVLVSLTGVFSQLPNALLGAMIVVSVRKLFDYRTPRVLWRRAHYADLVQLFGAMIATVSFSIEVGVMTAVGLGMLQLLMRGAKLEVTELAHIDDTWLSKKEFPLACRVPKVMVVRLSGDAHFAGAAPALTQLCEMIKARSELRAIVLDWSRVTFVDFSFLQRLAPILENAHTRHIAVCFASVNEPVRHRLQLAAELFACVCPRGRLQHGTPGETDTCERVVEMEEPEPGESDIEVDIPAPYEYADEPASAEEATPPHGLLRFFRDVPAAVHFCVSRGFTCVFDEDEDNESDNSSRHVEMSLLDDSRTPVSNSKRAKATSVDLDDED